MLIGYVERSVKTIFMPEVEAPTIGKLGARPTPLSRVLRTKQRERHRLPDGAPAFSIDPIVRLTTLDSQPLERRVSSRTR